MLVLSVADLWKLVDEGENFRIAVWRGVAYCQVWRRPDVSASDGTRFAAVLMNSLRMLLTDDDNAVPGIVFDVREAPATSGPNTIALLAELVGSWSIVGKRVAILVGPVEQSVQMGELLRVHGNSRGAVFADVDGALSYAAAS
ncbi:MAG TPA: hypothetical protein VGO62_08265 [Myxococcota bacterium]